jgi:REP element-mobilizing transposase RayT
MAGVRNKVYLHFIWATYDRQNKMTPDVQEVLFRQIRAVGQELDCPVQAIGGIENHLHVVVLFSTSRTISKLVKDMKGSSSHLANEVFPDLHFQWQGGYGVYPVSPQALQKVMDYVNNQEEHHKNNTLNVYLEEMEKH